MTEWIWFNGNVTPLADARISVEDRGFQFADGVYEVIRVYAGKAFALPEHLQRLEKSAAGIQIDLPLSRTVLGVEIEKLIHKSQLGEGMIYLQLSRGASTRNHLFPDSAVIKPTLLFYTRALNALPEPRDVPGVKLISVPDERWKRCWIKSIALLANVLAKNHAVSHGGDEAVFVEDGLVSECSASNIHAILNGKLISPPPGPKVLPGITRQVLLEAARRLGVDVEERQFTVAEALQSEELFITSTTRELNWVKQWDEKPLAGQAGLVTLRLHEEFQKMVGEALSGRPFDLTESRRVVFGCR